MPAWWGYLLALDAAVHRLAGRSLLSEKPREVAIMLFWSVPFWFLYEAYNLVIDNWYYVFILHDDRLQEVVAWLAFATVLPACFFHAELVRALGWFEELRWPSLPFGRTTVVVCLVLGLLSVVAPLLWPRHAFPLVWGVTLWWPALLNYWCGAPSLLMDLELGNPQRLLRLLVGGLFAGLVWEVMNFWARSKWIYTVPGFEELKLFEMPVVGFLGFPFLALAAFSYYAMVSWWLRGGDWWEIGPFHELLWRDAGPVSRVACWVVVVLAAIFSHQMYDEVIEHSVRSRRPLLGEIGVLESEHVAALRSEEVETPELLVRAGDRRHDLARRTGIEPWRLRAAATTARLALHKGMGTSAARRLQAVGVDRAEELARADPEALWRRLEETSADADDRSEIRLAEVRVWVRAARFADGVRR